MPSNDKNSRHANEMQCQLRVQWQPMSGQRMLTSRSFTNQAHDVEQLIKHVAKNNIPSEAIAERMQLQKSRDLAIKGELSPVANWLITDKRIASF